MITLIAPVGSTNSLSRCSLYLGSKGQGSPGGHFYVRVKDVQEYWTGMAAHVLNNERHVNEHAFAEVHGMCNRTIFLFSRDVATL